MLDSSENLDLVNSTATGNLLQTDDSSALISETGYGLETSIPVENLQTGIFTVGESGEVTFDYLFDGGNFEGELAIFNIEGMDLYGGGSKIFSQEAALRALQNSPEWGHVIISDAIEGAKFSGATDYEGDFNKGEYLGSKTFEMTTGSKFGVMLVADGTIQDTLLNPDLIGTNRPLFSVESANPGEEIQFVKVFETGEDGDRREQGEAFGFEDVAINQEYSDKDFNDLMFEVEGATGKATLLDEVINPERDWRKYKIGEEIIQAAVDAEDLAGNTPREARKTLPSTAGKTYQGWVGSNDTDDYHAFSLGTSNEFNLSLDGLTSNANVEIIDIDENIVFSSENPGTTEESISGVLGSGAYRVRVTSVDEFGTPYNLKLSINPLIPGITTSGSQKLNFTFTKESLSLINLDNFGDNNPAFRQDSRFQGIDGSGFSTVIIDSGINLNHPFFGPDVNDDKISDRIIVDGETDAGHDFADNDDDPEDVTKGSAAGHGSNVASIAAGFFADSKQPYKGVAPGANIIPLKVFSNVREGALDGDIEQALQWVIANAERYNIASVNLSLGSENYNTPLSFSGGGVFGDELQRLSELGVIVVAASGNNFFDFQSAQGVAYPSADPYTLSIGNVWDKNNGNNFGRWDDTNGDNIGDQLRDDIAAADYTTGADRIRSSSQRSEVLTTVFAPGARTTGAGLDDNPASDKFRSTMGGTSQAAPHVAGMAVLAQQLAERELKRRLSPNEFRELLQETGVPIFDGDDENDNVNNTGLTFRRADMLALANEIVKPTDEFEIQIPDVIEFRPLHTNGDKEFGGNGPRIEVKAQVVADGSTLKVVGDALFEETGGDYTTFNGSFSSNVIDISRENPGYVIDSIVSEEKDSLETTDADYHDKQVIFQDSNDLVAKYELQGDTDQGFFSKGSDKPFVTISFNPVKLKLLNRETKEVIEDEFLLPSNKTFTPPRIKGDNEFSGNGPKIYIETEVIPRNSILKSRISASFTETNDGTTFADNREEDLIDVSDRYPGFIIDSILSDNRDTLDTTDLKRVATQDISLDDSELVRKYTLEGDSKGNDEPFVSLSFNPVKVKLRRV